MNNVLLLILALSSLPAWADSNYDPIFGDAPDNSSYSGDDNPAFKEDRLVLPAFPQTGSLIPFTVSSATDNRHSIDAKSIAIGDDGVVRYTIVIDSQQGARTINYEGMRCESAQYKIYAFGRDDGSWSVNHYAKWEDIRLRSLLSYRKALFEGDFCRNNLRVRNAAEAIRNLKQASQ
jgi:hypothetical protein